MQAIDTIRAAYDKCQNSNHQTHRVAASIYGDGTLFGIACAVIYLGKKYDGFVEMVGEQENYECQTCTLDGIRWDDPEVDVDKINEMFSTFVHSDIYINYTGIFKDLEPALDCPSEDPPEDLSGYANKESFYKMMDRDGWPGCISLKDLKRQHPAGIYVRRDEYFYFLSDCGTLGYYEPTIYQNRDGGDDMMFCDEENYAEIELLGEDEIQELKEIAFEIKKNFEKVFDDIYLYDYINHTHTEEFKAKYL